MMSYILFGQKKSLFSLIICVLENKVFDGKGRGGERRGGEEIQVLFLYPFFMGTGEIQILIQRSNVLVIN